MLDTALSVFLFVLSFVIGAGFLGFLFIFCMIVYIAYNGGR